MWGDLLKKLSALDQPERLRFIDDARVKFGLDKEWDAKFRSGEAQRRRFSLLNLNELRQLVDEGMSVGSHTLSHPILSQQEPDLAWKEISESKDKLEKALGTASMGIGVSVRGSGFGDEARMANGGASGFRVCLHECWGRVRGAVAEVRAAAGPRNFGDGAG